MTKSPVSNDSNQAKKKKLPARRVGVVSSRCFFFLTDKYCSILTCIGNCEFLRVNLIEVRMSGFAPDVLNRVIHR